MPKGKFYEGFCFVSFFTAASAINYSHLQPHLQNSTMHPETPPPPPSPNPRCCQTVATVHLVSLLSSLLTFFTSWPVKCCCLFELNYSSSSIIFHWFTLNDVNSCVAGKPQAVGHCRNGVVGASEAPIEAHMKN